MSAVGAPLTPWARYQQDLNDPEFVHDPAQEAVVRRLQTLYEALLSPRRFMDRLLRRHRTPLRGMYLWGGVGRGKTYLMDCFYECLPRDMRLRLHFHRCMQRVHGRLRQHAHRRDPLVRVARSLAGQARVLCFDEFFVTDIGDAMILAGLLQGLFDMGIVLVATSNVAPDDLYRDGLQRVRFLPAIGLIREHTEIVELSGDCDYRLRFLERADIYHCPLDGRATEVLADNFGHLAPDGGVPDTQMEINGRSVPLVRRSGGVAWFDFDVLCRGPRSALDYVEIARCFHSVLLSGVPILVADMDSEARRFISMVDEFYDRNVKLIVSAAATPGRLYEGRRLAFEFRRTASRLTEMQSRDYLAKPHLP